MNLAQAYPIGTPGLKWGDEEKSAWLGAQTIKRSYPEEVLAKITPLQEHYDVDQYGELSYEQRSYPLFIVKTRPWDDSKATILVTGGVHGYETSGVQGAIRFLETRAKEYEKHFNIVVAPCLSPWGYETINRWNSDALDPNRSFYPDSPVPESACLMQYLSALKAKFIGHIDLHETTDTDNSEFRPALSARDAIEHEEWDIPDGFYLVGDIENPMDDFQKAIIESVEKITHIAPADDDGRLIGVALSQPGVINYEIQALGLCAGLTGASYCTTTEVYPDSALVDDENCIGAQVAAVTGGLNYIISRQ